MSRIKKTLLNARVNLIFYTVNLFLSFYSRKFFIITLGTTFLGLTGTISNLLGFLNLTELGVGTAITYLLFKPIANNNRYEINNILSLLRFYYQKIGLYIIIGGIILSAFFPLIFKNSPINLYIVYTSFYVYLIISFLDYYFNYLQLLLVADQKNYLKTTYTGSANILKVLLQIIALSYFENKIIWFLIIEVLFSSIKILIIKKIIIKEYKWLKLNTTFKTADNFNTEIKIKTRQIFSHQIAGYILTQTDQLLIFAFTSLSMVTYYANYTLVLGRIISLIDQFLNSSYASVGNLIASGNKDHIKKVFNEMIILRYWISGIIIFSAYHFVPPIIKLWLGDKFILSNNIFILMLINNYIMMTRQPIDIFLNTSGIYRDTWAPWAEAIINLIVSIVAGYYFGIAGILFGTFISMLFIVVLWKPYLLYSEGFNEGVKAHWMNLFVYFSTFIVCFVLISYGLQHFSFQYFSNIYVNLFFTALVSSSLFSLIYFLILYILEDAMRSLTKRFMPLLIKIINE
ncbi:hypothetical protein PBAC_01340 [Pedobacter glucosidilyticus]|nr:hypothetical protein [Pedobacter glucosidilyticus]KHJ39623.1 hypothetical protein PBAC_01340 [Pedobacter glucosidilyticus]